MASGKSLLCCSDTKPTWNYLKLTPDIQHINFYTYLVRVIFYTRIAIKSFLIAAYHSTENKRQFYPFFNFIIYYFVKENIKTSLDKVSDSPKHFIYHTQTIYYSGSMVRRQHRHNQVKRQESLSSPPLTFTKDVFNYKKQQDNTQDKQ